MRKIWALLFFVFVLSFSSYAQVEEPENNDEEDIETIDSTKIKAAQDSIKKAVCDSGEDAMRFQLKDGTIKLGLFIRQEPKGFILKTLGNKEELLPQKDIAKILYGYKFSALDCK